MLTGNHLIAGEWRKGHGGFESAPATGKPRLFSNGTPELVDQAACRAESAFESYRSSSRRTRAEFLQAIADQIEQRSAAITRIAASESGLPVARIQGEIGRTTGQLRLFAEHVLTGDYLERCSSVALPDRIPLPRPDLKRMMQAIGPVVVFGASNFPLAFSTAGGDTASALAAGCPVIVKAHPAHPGTGELVAQAVLEAIHQVSLDPGVFSFIQDSGHSVARALVQHPLIQAVGFTGSFAAGRSLFDLCNARPEPIPFFGELASINPGFVLAEALTNRSLEIAAGWAASLSLGAGQFCTNPGVMIVQDGDLANEFVEQTVAELETLEAQTMLSDSIADAFRDGVSRLNSLQGVSKRIGTPAAGRSAMPYLFELSSATWRANPELADEIFGPVGLVVRAADIDDMLGLARSLTGQLTTTLHIDEEDYPQAAQLLPLLQRKAGRVLANGFPTGVEVDSAMMHGGPYPASTNAAATSVGTMAIRRFLRPVCYQNIPQQLLPVDLRCENFDSSPTATV